MKKKRTIIILIIFVVILGYFTMTPVGALRLSIAASGHPISAFTFQIKEEPYSFHLEGNQIGYSLDNPPFEKATNSDLINWVVTKHGIFYTAQYYGWA